MEHKHIPFANLGIKGWQNSGILAIIVFYLINTVWTLSVGGLFNDTFGTDYLSLWTAGRIANESGYANAYNIIKLGAIQQNILEPNGQTIIFHPLPAPLLPIFLIPFQALSLLTPKVGFLVWTIINVLIFFIYSKFFLNRMHIEQWQRLTILMLLSFPVFYNFFCGQINIWLEIFTGEFFRCVLNKRKLEGGLWLGGLLLKPQLLVLIIVFLIIKKEWKTFIGFVISSICLVGLSLWLGGIASISNLIKLWLNFSPRLSESMMNWRMIGLKLQELGYPIEGWGIALIGTIITLWILLLLWKKYDHNNDKKTAVIYFGTIAGTFAATWYAHIHMAIVLIPLLLYLYGKKLLPEKLFNFYVFFMPFANIILSIPVAILGWDKYNALMGLMALCTLLVNLTMLYWANHVLENPLLLQT